MPTADLQTPIRPANDLDVLDEAAWTYLERCGWVCTPQLLFAVKQAIIDEYIIRDDPE
jgi:hypothetical protein